MRVRCRRRTLPRQARTHRVKARRGRPKAELFEQIRDQRVLRVAGLAQTANAISGFDRSEQIIMIERRVEHARRAIYIGDDNQRRARAA